MVFDKEESLCTFLKRFAYPCRYQDLMLRFGQRAVMHDIKSSTKYYLRELGIFNEKYEPKLVAQENS